ncbi:hypothetical protein STCU_11760 [Strigomonas culicis]|uniref:ZZ-type domain-containing protein n=1 Tax=Strigomonas culicis TaxID=28005 RepID=S9UZ21_9TRYP|nr:hypothetical protein STCU_11760 [Strigomonas culicis]|eukprot:EPY15795.1 hypothetical protein STCU_11760 [Strigomonas culicis]
MSVFFRPVLNWPAAYRTLVREGAYNICNGCRKPAYPNSAKWYRCNTCRNYDLCGTCWDKEYADHEGGRHTFTDMSTALRNTCGFPTIDDQKEWYGSAPYETCTCKGCGSTVSNHRFFHCNQCPQPGYDLCVECMVTKDLWHTHSGSSGAAHTFTNALHLHLGGMRDNLGIGRLLSQLLN